MTPNWPAPQNIHAIHTGREQGLAYPHTDPTAREAIATSLPCPTNILWLQQVHGSTVIHNDQHHPEIKADASYTSSKQVVCAVMTADCLPILICNKQGTKVAAIHAGWRGLHAGIITNTLTSINLKAEDTLIWLGPAIGPSAFEVGIDVFEAFKQKSNENIKAFRPTKNQHWLADIYQLARNELQTKGISQIYGGQHCTYTEKENFYSYRRNHKTGRMLSLIWLD